MRADWNSAQDRPIPLLLLPTSLLPPPPSRPTRHLGIKLYKQPKMWPPSSISVTGHKSTVIHKPAGPERNLLLSAHKRRFDTSSSSSSSSSRSRHERRAGVVVASACQWKQGHKDRVEKVTVPAACILWRWRRWCWPISQWKQKKRALLLFWLCCSSL